MPSNTSPPVANIKSPPWNPFPLLVKTITMLLILAFINIFYATSIDILSNEAAIISCSKPDADTANGTECGMLIQDLKKTAFMEWILWSIYILAVMAPLKVMFLHAYVSTEDAFNDYKYKSWGCFIFLLLSYFTVMMIAVMRQSSSYFFSAIPALIGIPLAIVIPVYYYILFKSKSENTITIPVIGKILYAMTVIGIIALSFYIVWEPKSDDEALRRGVCLLSCAYYFAWLAAEMLVGEIHYNYITNCTSHSLIKAQTNVDFNIDHEARHVNIATPEVNDLITMINTQYKTVPYLNHVLSFIVISIFVSWVAMSNIAANASILGVVIIFPALSLIADKAQSSFDNLLKTKLYKLN